ncbi:amidase [Chitinophaga costaii]|uniref:Amidase n=1 Tax=Chitinophaga costaii TaxID=1335309 RepID=A0A1C4G6H6_9BACT|nr:amidase [Chitinophaga costaii]PUZ19597.1 amidase [Chitinophaga costaii]SCC63790.1 amidase [Chitinophaga costaii]
MNRRHFLKSGSLLGLPAFTGLSLKPGRGKAFPIPDFPLQEVTLQTLQEQMKSGALTSSTITEMYIRRIQAIDQAGPQLRAVIALNPDAGAIAAAMDQERKEGKLRGPLHGIPVLIKDNIDTGDKMITSAGSLALADNRALQDAFIVAKLRAAGAVLLGKTNLSEWANFRSTRSISGWSSRGRQTRSPYVLDRNPCGSSSGAAVAVAANLCAVAIGTETDGSIVCPASACGIVGIKPTVGLLSRSGIIPISVTQDTAGPMARTVADAAALLGVLAGADEKDEATAGGHIQQDYTKFLNAKGLRGKRIGFEKSMLQRHEQVDVLVQQALDTLRAQGATVVEVELAKIVDALAENELKVLEYEFKDGLNKYLASANSAMKSLEDVIAFNKAHADKVMPYFQQEILETSHVKGDLQTPEYVAAQSGNRNTAQNAIHHLLQQHRLDALCGVTFGPSCCIDPIHGDANTGYDFSSPAAIAGYPHITVPMGQVAGLPVGLSFFAGAWQEGAIITLAYAYEQATKWRMAPGFLETVGME